MCAQWRLGCPGWSESSLGAQSFCWFHHEAALSVYPHRNVRTNTVMLLKRSRVVRLLKIGNSAPKTSINSSGLNLVRNLRNIYHHRRERLTVARKTLYALVKKLLFMVKPKDITYMWSPGFCIALTFYLCLTPRLGNYIDFTSAP